MSTTEWRATACAPPLSAYQRAVKQKRRVRRARVPKGLKLGARLEENCDEGAHGSRHMKPASVGEICSAIFCSRNGSAPKSQTPKSLPAVSDCRVSEQSGGAVEENQSKTRLPAHCRYGESEKHKLQTLIQKKRSVSLLLLNDN